MDDPAQHPAIVDARHAACIRRQKRSDPSPLRIRKPKEIRHFHRLLAGNNESCQPRFGNPLNRHFPANLQIHGNRIYIAPPRELHSLRSPPMTRLWRADQVRNAIWQSIPPSRRISPIVFTSPLISSAYAGTGLGRRSSIKLKIFWNKLLGTATSANWNVTYRP